MDCISNVTRIDEGVGVCKMTHPRSGSAEVDHTNNASTRSAMKEAGAKVSPWLSLDVFPYRASKSLR